jgi:hypothetical protein
MPHNPSQRRAKPMTVIFMHDLNAAGFQDLDALLDEVEARFGPGLVENIHPLEGELLSSQAAIAELDDRMPAEDREMLSQLVALSDAPE